MDLNRQDKDRLWRLLNQKEQVSKPVLTVLVILGLGSVFTWFGWNKLIEYREQEWVMAVSPLTRWCHHFQAGDYDAVLKAQGVTRQPLEKSQSECLCLTNPVYRLNMIIAVSSSWRQHYEGLQKRSDFVEKRVTAIDEGWRALLPGGAILPVAYNDPDSRALKDLAAYMQIATTGNADNPLIKSLQSQSPACDQLK